MFFSRIIGVGAYLPSNVVKNDDLATLVDTTNEWIVGRTGIKERRFASVDEMTSDMAVKASLSAMDDAGIKSEEIDMIILATVTGDSFFPSTAVKVQSGLRMRNGYAFDIQSGEAGFLSALSVADNAIKTGQAKKVLVVGADTASRLIDKKDRNTYPLFGDGAGAVILDRADEADRGIIDTRLYSDGRLSDAMFVNGGIGLGHFGCIKMNGKEVSSFAIDNIVSAVKNILEANNYTAEDIKLFIPRQSDEHTAKTAAKRLGIDWQKTECAFTEYADTLSASLPLALTKSIKNGKMMKNDLMVIASMGSGFTWGASIIRW